MSVSLGYRSGGQRRNRSHNRGGMPAQKGRIPYGMSDQVPPGTNRHPWLPRPDFLYSKTPRHSHFFQRKCQLFSCYLDRRVIPYNVTSYAVLRRFPLDGSFILLNRNDFGCSRGRSRRRQRHPQAKACHKQGEEKSSHRSPPILMEHAHPLLWFVPTKESGASLLRHGNGGSPSSSHFCRRYLIHAAMTKTTITAFKMPPRVLTITINIFVPPFQRGSTFRTGRCPCGGSFL